MSRYAGCLLALLLWLLAGCAYDRANRTDDLGAPIDERTGQPMETVNPDNPAYGDMRLHLPKIPGQPNPVVIPP